MKHRIFSSHTLGGLVLAWGALLSAPQCAAQASATSAPGNLPEAAKAISGASPEAEAFVQKIKSGALLAMSDEQLLKTFKQLDPQTIPNYLDLGLKSLNECEIWMKRQERLSSGWTKQPFITYIKYRHKPRQVYVKWLKDSPKSGQEIIYDETKRKDASYGHFGGLFNVASIWTSIDGTMAKGNSNHTVRDLGMQSVVAIVVDSNRRRLKEGLPIAPHQIEIAKIDGERTIALTWVTPPGMTGGYAAKSKVHVNLAQPWVRMIESWDEGGEMKERISFDKVVPATFTDADFDPKNSSYGF